MSAQIEVLKSKYVDLRVRIVGELDRVEGRLKFYAESEKDSQTAVMEKKYVERRDKLYAELDRVDSRLQSYASMKKVSNGTQALNVTQISEATPEQPAEPVKTQKMYRGRPVA